MPRVLTTHPLAPKAAEELAKVAELVIAPALDADSLRRAAQGCEAIIVRANLPDDIFTAAPSLRAAVRHGAGLDMIPLAEATREGVLVANVPGANAVAVAEHVFMVTLALLRRFRSVERDLRRTGWLAARDHATAGQDLAGRRLGILGLGHVGQAVARIGQFGFGLEVIAHSRHPERFPDHVRAVDLDGLMAGADIVVLCCPLSDATRGLVDASRIARMRPHALLINVARGPVVEEADLITALREGRIGGAALDVFDRQPLAPEHPYLGFDNVIVTPHMAGITEQSMERMGRGAVAEVIRILQGGLPENLCNPEAVAVYRKRFPE